MNGYEGVTPIMIPVEKRQCPGGLQRQRLNRWDLRTQLHAKRLKRRKISVEIILATKAKRLGCDVGGLAFQPAQRLSGGSYPTRVLALTSLTDGA
ncbi:hypothetical protein NKH89_33830 [Mesorhizobium sp. M0923]|uniref:hypothetical protein n=1 Tax=unclassified Mesorhizobium TaxID=325217 RepID=UPI0033363CB2